MAWHFDETSGHHVLLGDNAALTLPDGDWTIAGWIYLDDNAGNFFQYFLSWGAVSASPSLNWFVDETGEANANKLKVIAYDAGGDNYEFASPGTPIVGATAKWLHFILVHSGNTLLQYIDNVLDASEVDAAVGAIDVGASMYLGMREDNNADRRFGGSMAEWAKWDRALNAGERGALVAGYSPMFFPTPKWYVPMIRSYQELAVPLTVTNNNSTVIAHPRIIRPAMPMLGLHIAAAPAAGNIVPIIDHHNRMMTMMGS